MSERALILSCDAWDMVDEKTGEMRRGLSVWYVNDYREDSESSFGYKPTKVSADRALLDSFKLASLPALFDLDFGSRPGAQGKATLTLVDARKVQSVNLFQSTAAPKVSATSPASA
ncbi:hypothetical protein D3C78_449840 [compost metagenome]